MAAITLADVDDYITPSQACINPLFTSEKKKHGGDEKKLNGSADGANTKGEKGFQPKKVIKRRRRRTPLTLNQSPPNPPPQPLPHNTLDHIGIQEAPKRHPILDRPTISYAIDDINTLNTAETLTTTNSFQNAPNETINATTNTEAMSKGKGKEKATVSVADCLACSGCITSAEAVLVTTQHSIKTLMEKCTPPQNSEKRIVFTISPATIAELTRVFDMNTDTPMNKDVDMSGEPNNGVSSAKRADLTDAVHGKLTTFLRDKFNAEVVLDGSIPQRIALYESALEFCHRYKYAQSLRSMKKANDNHMIDNENMGRQESLDPRINITTPTIALSATETRFLVQSEQKADPSNQLEAIEVKHDAGIDSRLKFMHSNIASRIHTSGMKSSHAMPMLASSCPGFVCYVEKTVKDAVPNLCSVKSPMAIAGSIFKHDLLQQLKISPSVGDYDISNDAPNKMGCVSGKGEIYHVSIMPCHDKKLEAERKDLAWERFNEQHESLVPDVDLVITTNEIMTCIMDAAMENEDDTTLSSNVKDNLERFQKAQKYFQGLQPHVTNSQDRGILCLSNKESSNRTLVQDDISTLKGSGSYADFIFRFASSALFGHEIPPTVKLPWKNSTDKIRRRNRLRISQNGGNVLGDSNEVCLYRHVDNTYSFEKKDHANDEAVLSFSTAYGFKNIQLMMQRVSNGDMKMHGYHYVEVMACPAGCANGGGQTHAASGNRREKPSDMRERVEKTRQFMHDVLPRSKIGVAKDLSMSEPKSLLHTRFHVVPKLELSTGATAGVAVDDTQW